MTRKEAVALLERYSNYDGMGISNLAGCKEAMKVAVDALKEAYPELAESEDERIRKELVAFFIEVRNREGNEGYWHDLKVANILAYLEKQKPAVYLDKDMVYAIMNKLHKLAFSQLIPINCDEYKKIEEITSDVRKLLDYPIEPKPAERSDDSVKFEEGFKAGRESGLLDGQKYVLNNLDSYGLCKLEQSGWRGRRKNK